MADKARILFVDDEKRVLNSMRGLFRREYELFLANEGAEAIRIATENDIDVIVADQRMPGMTGIEVLARIKERSPRTVRILLTGYADPSAVEGSINIGEVFRFLSKPCPPKMLRETLSLATAAARTRPVPPPTASPAPAQPAAASPQPAAAPPQPAAQTAAPAAQPTPQPPRPQAIAPETARPAPPAAQPARPAAAAAPVPPPSAAATPEAPRPAQEQQQQQPTIGDNDETQPSLPVIDESDLEATGEHSTSHWQSVTNVIMSEDTVEETQENVALSADTLGMNDVGVVVFTIDSEFAATAIRAVSEERDTVLATTLVKVAQAIEEQNAGVLVTDFTTNSKMLQKIVGALKQRMPELVTIVVSGGRDTTDMINLINYGQIYRYVLKPIEPAELRSNINAAVIHHLYLLNNPESIKRHHVIDHPETGESSTTLNRFLSRIRNRQDTQTDPTDTTT